MEQSIRFYFYEQKFFPDICEDMELKQRILQLQKDRLLKVFVVDYMPINFRRL